MDLKAVACGNCGAALKTPGEARFVTCNHCGSLLEIKHTESVTYSETIAQIDARTERIEQQLLAMRLEQELEVLDREWSQRRRAFRVSAKDGLPIPSRVQYLGAAIIVCAFGILLAVSAIRGQSGLADVMVGLVTVALGFGLATFGHARVDAYDSAQRRYWQRRQELEARLAQAHENGSLPSHAQVDAGA